MGSGAEASSAGERRSGALILDDRRWEWEARHSPPEDEDGAENPFLCWYEITFRRSGDAEQKAFARAGIPDGGWSDETLRQVLRSARTRRWRDPSGDLWTVRLEGWSGRGISTEVAAAEEESGRAVVFVPLEGGEEIRRTAPDVESITDLPDGRLAQLLEGED